MVRKLAMMHICGEPIPIFEHLTNATIVNNASGTGLLYLHEHRYLDLSHLALDRKVGPTVKCTHVRSFGRLRSDVGTDAVAML